MCSAWFFFQLNFHPPEFYSMWKPPELFLKLHCPVLGAHSVVYSTIIPLMEVWVFLGFCYFRQWGNEQLCVSGIFCVWRCLLGQIAGSGFIGLNLLSVSLPHKMGCYTLKKKLSICLFVCIRSQLQYPGLSVFVSAGGIFSCVTLTLVCSLWDLVPLPGTEPRPPALGAQSLSHWTPREVPGCYTLGFL